MRWPHSSRNQTRWILRWATERSCRTCSTVLLTRQFWTSSWSMRSAWKKSMISMSTTSKPCWKNWVQIWVIEAIWTAQLLGQTRRPSRSYSRNWKSWKGAHQWDWESSSWIKYRCSRSRRQTSIFSRRMCSSSTRYSLSSSKTTTLS